MVVRDESRKRERKTEPELRVADVEDIGYVRPYSRSLPLQLMRAREAMMQRFRPHFTRNNLTDQQWRIIRVLVENQSLEILDLSAHCCMQPASLSRILPKMQKDGIITRTVNPKDQRRISIALTEKGARLFKRIAPHTDMEYAKIVDLIGEQHMDELYDALDLLIAKLKT
jgi:homoprotocatechuate degradation regulator HpaR